MKTLVLVGCFVFLLLLSLSSIAVLLPGMKEGFSTSEMPLYAGVAAGALVLALLWHRICRARPLWRSLGFTVLALPFIGHGCTFLLLAKAVWDGERFASEAVILDYREVPLLWPGFDGPVGYRLEIALRHPEGTTPLIYPPKVAMTAAEGDELNYWSRLAENGRDLSHLRAVVFQTLFEDPTAEQPYNRWIGPRRAAAKGRSDLTFYLLPDTIEFLPSENQVCLRSSLPGQPICAAGQTREEGCFDPTRGRQRPTTWGEAGALTVIWRAFGSNDMEAQLDDLLAGQLAKSSAMVGDPERWQALHRRMTPQGLARAGYDLCLPGKNSHTRSRICYCR